MSSLRRQPLEAALCAILVTIVAVTFAQVVFRYALQASLTWSEELARFLLMWLAALSAAYAFKERAHFALNFVVDRFGDGGRRVLRSVVTTIVSVFLLVFAWQSARFVFEVRDQIAPATRMSMAVPYSSAVVGSVLMLYYVLVNWWRGGDATPASNGAAPGSD